MWRKIIFSKRTEKFKIECILTKKRWFWRKIFKTARSVWVSKISILDILVLDEGFFVLKLLYKLSFHIAKGI